jgi:hypothetical protein
MIIVMALWQGRQQHLRLIHRKGDYLIAEMLSHFYSFID